MKKLSSFVTRMTSPLLLTAEDGLAFWQEKVLLNLLLVTVVLGGITYVPSLLLALKENLLIIAIMDSLMYGAVIILFFRRDIPFSIRATGTTLISYILGLVLLATLGPFGAGPVWLFFFPVITGVLLGQRQAFFSLAINLFTLIGLGILIHYHLDDFLVSMNFKVWFLTPENPIEKWVVICLNFMLLNVIAVLSLTTLMKGLQKSISSLAESEKKYRRIYETIPDVYFETNLDAALLEVSPSIEKVTDYTQDELRGRSLLNLYKDLKQREEVIKLLITSGSVRNHEIDFINKNGEVFCCSINAGLIRNDKGQPERVAGVLRDVSVLKILEKEKRELEERLLRSQKMEALGLLAGGVAHDLNNILSGIVTYPELMAMDLAEDDPLRKSLDIIRASGLKAADTVQDLLTLSRRGVIIKDIINFNDMISNFLNSPEYLKIMSFHPLVRVEKDIAAPFPFIRGSMVHLQKSVMNLVSNAAEAQPGGGVIRITTANRSIESPLKGYEQVGAGKYLVLSVSDEGIGIDPEDLKRIFEPFFTKKVMGRSGSGLGMGVVWGTVQDHRGYIDIDSMPGKGTRFDLYFPVSTDMPESYERTFSIEHIRGKGEKILVVDDVMEQRQIAEILLKKLGYEATSVESGEAAVSYLKNNTADLLLLDMIMDPGIDGCETYKRIIAFRPGQKAVIASGFSHTPQVDEALALGAGQYLKKPYTIEKLGRTIRAELIKP